MNKCAIKWCKNPRYIKSRSLFCLIHKEKVTIHSYLSRKYRGMKLRVEGRQGKYASKDNKYYLGKPIVSKDVFLLWAKNHRDFLRLYKQYVAARFDRKLSPSVNRIDSNLGYTLDNMEWVTTSQNCSMAAALYKQRNKGKKVVYKILIYSPLERPKYR